MVVERAALSAVCLVVRTVGSMVGGSVDLLVASMAALSAEKMVDQRVER